MFFLYFNRIYEILFKEINKLNFINNLYLITLKNNERFIRGYYSHSQ